MNLVVKARCSDVSMCTRQERIRAKPYATESHAEGMAHKFDPSRKEVLDDPDRKRWQDPEGIFNAFDVRPGSVIADVGCGTGFFSIPAASRVRPSGKVYAIDLQEEMLWTLQERLVGQGIDNVLPVLSTEEAIPLPSGCVDVVLLMNALHELVGEATLQESKRILRPGGFMVVIDWKREPMDMGPPLEHRLSEEEAARRLRALGLEVEQAWSGPYHYGLKATKASG